LEKKSEKRAVSYKVRNFVGGPPKELRGENAGKVFASHTYTSRGVAEEEVPPAWLFRTLDLKESFLKKRNFHVFKITSVRQIIKSEAWGKAALSF